jgi:hypothetical protein
MGTFFCTFYSICLSHYDSLYRFFYGNNPDFNEAMRAVAIQTGIPNTIIRQAEHAPGGLRSAFQNPNKFLGYTEQTYVCHPIASS